jgi:DNA-directed RNA polymerase subunit E'/Rpb7
MSLSTGPYFNTYLYDTVTLYANQMNNDIYSHLKSNLINKHQNRCFGKYGYISKLHKIEEKTGGKLIPEDPMASAVYDVKFSCKVCRPLKESIIVCEVIAINKVLVHLRNGPISILIFEASGHINKENFVFDERKNLLMAYIDKNKKQGVPVIKGTFVKVKIIDVHMENNAERIVVIGTLESIASKTEIEESVKAREMDGVGYVNYNEYIAGKEAKNVADAPPGAQEVEQDATDDTTGSTESESDEPDD